MTINELANKVLSLESAVVRLTAQVEAGKPESDDTLEIERLRDCLHLSGEMYKQKDKEVSALRARVAELEQYNSNLSMGWSRSKEAMDAAQAERDAARADLAAEKSANEELHKRLSEMVPLADLIKEQAKGNWRGQHELLPWM